MSLRSIRLTPSSKGTGHGQQQVGRLCRGHNDSLLQKYIDTGFFYSNYAGAPWTSGARS